MINFNVTIGDKLICPVCGKEFTVTEDTKYIAAGGFTCDWKCFMVKAREPKQDKKKNVNKM